jgi:hypothetical protein
MGEEGDIGDGGEEVPAIQVVVKDLVALAAVVSVIIAEVVALHGDKILLEKELTSKRVNLDQLKAFAKTVAKVAVGGSKAILAARIISKIMP